MPTLSGIIPILITPFDEAGRIDEESLRRVVHFELEGGVHGIGVGGFASEAYKLTDQERIRCAEIVAAEVNGQVPLIIGMAPGSTEAAIEQAHIYSNLHPAALMTLPPNTMINDEMSLMEHYIALGNASDVPIMVQQSPQIPAYAHCQLSTEHLAQIAKHAPNIRYFKIEGPGSARRINALRARVSDDVRLFGGIGGLTLREELEVGAAGLLPGVGFNEFFVDVWSAWTEDNKAHVDEVLLRAQPLVDAVSGFGHEFSLHARKYLLKRAGIITHDTVRRPTVRAEFAALDNVAHLIDEMGLRLGRHA
ncbi:MAG: dihydrodipicolinate synthase family protein [Chloroflexi bacterium]|nr:dihydrodipicolinate synthase family protein [Chloroflexota bacterium]MCC6896628.1 dihydrodipicolinate synthase family protein [Anaerolineae bacterium]